MRMIDKDAILHDLENGVYPASMTYTLAVDIAKGLIEVASEIDAVPVVRGEWKLYGNDDDSGMSYWCTACNFHLSEDLFYSGYKNGKWIENGVFKYCPMCGAKLEDKT